MMIKYNYLLHIIFLVFSNLVFSQNEFITKFEQSKGTETVTYEEGITYFTALAKEFSTLQIEEYGNTDCGKPLHLIVFSLDKDFNSKSLKNKGKNILLVNNAIHPGEPDGVDASMLLLRNLAQDKKLQKLVKNTVICVIPFYNVGGVLNRSSFSRANQNGPKEYGFRGNAKNLDLNRDFVKCDSKNALTFTKIFQTWQPDIYIENHVTNGADYQHVMTYLASQQDKLGGQLGEYLRQQIIPNLEKKMISKKFEMCPYVNVFGKTPDAGYRQFLDSPRYSSGYATLFQTVAFIAETHMLKPYKPRVDATYAFMLSNLEFLAKNGQKLQKLRQIDRENIKTKTDFVLNWELDTTKYKTINFKGFEAEYKQSQITGQKRLFYNRNKPFTKKIPFYNHYKAQKSIQKPLAYIIPQAWGKVIDLLKSNKVEFKQLRKDQEIEVLVYYIDDFETLSNPFESHYLHSEVKLHLETQTIQFRKGDYVVFTNQSTNRYIIETLEPEASDSFFNWNFFDSILQQKEWFSAYVFEATAERLLKENPKLKTEFEQKKKDDEKFATNTFQQLYFIYRNSPYYEKEHRRYPIFRLEKEISLE